MPLKSAVLISYPVGTDVGLDISTALYRPPVGLLIVADILRDIGVDVFLIDVAMEWAEFKKNHSINDSFAQYIAKHAVQYSAEFVGISSIAGTLPLSIRIAQEIRARDSESKICFGGPGASAVAEPLLKAFPEVDYILYGEVENALPYFVENFGESTLFDCHNLKFRVGEPDVTPCGVSEIIRINKPSELPKNFPPPDYKHWGYDIGLPYLPIEVGRGCPYHCAFCSTSTFFSNSYRLLKKEDLDQYIKHLIACCRPEGFEFAHDNFTVNSKKVIEICQLLASMPEKVAWNCSSDIRHISKELMKIMADAGCNIVFFGIETGSPRMQEVIKKNLPLDKVISAAEAAAENKVIFNGSFIIGYPDETEHDLRETINLIIDMLAVKESILTMSTLAPLAGTDYYERYKDELIFNRDNPARLAFQGAEIREDEKLLIEKNRDVFPEFYSFPHTYCDKNTLQSICDFLIGCYQIARYLLVGLHRMGFDGLDIILEFIDYAGKDKVGKALLEYYSSTEFVAELHSFYMHKLEQAALPREQFSFFEGLASPYIINKSVFYEYTFSGSIGPLLVPGASVVHSNVAISELPNNFSSYEDIHDSCMRPVSYLQIRNDSTFRTIEISREVGILLERCDGKTPIPQLIQSIKDVMPEIDDIYGKRLFDRLLAKEYIVSL